MEIIRVNKGRIVLFILIFFCAESFSQTKTKIETIKVNSGYPSIKLEAVREKGAIAVVGYNEHPTKTFKINVSVTATLRNNKGTYNQTVKKTFTLKPNSRYGEQDFGSSHYASSSAIETFSSLLEAEKNYCDVTEISDAANTNSEKTSSGTDVNNTDKAQAPATRPASAPATSTTASATTETRYNTDPKLKEAVERQNRLQSLQQQKQQQQQANYDKAVAYEEDRKKTMVQTRQTVEAITNVLTDIVKQRAEERQRQRDEEDRREEARRELQEEENARKEAIALKINNRKSALSEYPAKAIPLGSQEKAAAIYYFFYACNNAINDAEGAVCYISNVFEVGKYKDGTRAYTATVTTEVAGLTPFTEVLHGYYYTQQEAEKYRQMLIDILQNNGAAITEVSYKGKPGQIGATNNTSVTPPASKYGKVISTDNFAPATINTAKPSELPREEQTKDKSKYGKVIKID